MKYTCTFLFFFITAITFAQSTELRPGIVLPRMSTAQRNAIASPASGMLVFDTNTQSYWFRQGVTWSELPQSGSTSNYWQLSGLGGNEIRNTNSGGFWSKNPVGLTDISSSSSNPPIVPIDEAGTRLMWIPSRSAFRVGTVTEADRWNAANIGLFSFAAGFNTRASASYSNAIGHTAVASGGYANAIGFYTEAQGLYSLVLGSFASATASNAVAIGSNVVADGNFSTAMGYKVSAGGHSGVFIIGDNDPNGQGYTTGGVNNQFVARFRNGYYLLTSGDINRTGVQIANGQSAWSSISDSTRKERVVLADGESFLLKLRNLKLGSWNYKGQGISPERFYGPMAQEIFTAFGKDNYGTIGNDTTLSTLNMDGLLFIFSQALEKRTADLQAENETLKQIIKKLDARLMELEIYRKAEAGLSGK